MRIWHINGIKSYRASASVKADTKEEAEDLFSELDLDDCVDVERDIDTIDDIWTDEEDDGEEEE